MKAVLGKKQSISNEDWLKAMNEIETLVSKEDLDILVSDTIKDIQDKTKGKKVAYAWSAGKDSIVLGNICIKAGIKDCMIGVCNLEYPAFIDWIKANSPENLEIVNTGQDLKWLADHQDMLFPQKSDVAANWFAIVQHTAQRQYYQAHKLDMIILGRRRADGNFVGRGDNIYESKGVTRYSPLADWKHEYLLAYIHYYNLLLPPIYTWPNGYRCGTHPWPARQWTPDLQGGWKEVFDIDRSIVEEASKHIESAKIFMEGLK